MIQFIRVALVAALLPLAGCAQPGGDKLPSQPTKQGGATYAPIVSADHADAPGAKKAADATFRARPATGDNNTAGHARTVGTFQYYFVNAVQAAKPKRVVVAGSGANLASAYFAHDAGAREELQAAMNDLLARYPDRHDVSGELLHGSNKKYVVRVTFIAKGKPRELYYDVTRWVGYTQLHG
jgi:hypothetical protein